MPFVAEQLVAKAEPVRDGEIKRLIAPSEAERALPEHERQSRNKQADKNQALP